MSSNEVKESYSMTKYEGEYSSIYLRKSRFQTTYEKRFMQLEDLISYIGGFSNILFLFFGAIGKRQEFKNEQIEKEKENQKILEKPVALSFKKDNIQNALSLKQNNQENEKKGRSSLQIKQIIKNRTLQLITQYGYKTRFEYLTAQLQQKILKNNNVAIQFRYYIYMLSCKKLFNNEENQLIEKAKVLAESQLDVIQIIDRIQEIDRLKNVIFTKEQLTLFNYFPKKEICIFKEQNQNINNNENYIFSKQSPHNNQNNDRVKSRMSFFTQMKNKELDNYSQQFEDFNRAQLEKLEKTFDKIIENRHPDIYFQSMKQSDSVKNNLDPLQQKKYNELQSNNDMQQSLQFPKDRIDKQRRKQVLINLRIKNLKEKVIQQKEKEETTVVTQASAKYINIQESPIKKKYPKIPLMTYNHLNDIKMHYNTRRSSEINNNKRNQTQQLTFISDQQQRNQIFNPIQKQKVQSENLKNIKQELQKNDDNSNKSSFYQTIPASQFSQQINNNIKEQGQFIDDQSQQKENEESLLRLSTYNNFNIGQTNNKENQINKNLKINIQRQNSKRSQISSNLYDLEPSTNRKLIQNNKQAQELQDKSNYQSMQFKDYIENKNSPGLEVSNQNNDKSNFEISNIPFLPSHSKQLQQEIQYIENKSKLNKSQSPQNLKENDNNNNYNKNVRVINNDQSLEQSDENISQNQECTSKSGNQKEENFKNNLLDEDKNLNFNQAQKYINSFFQFSNLKNTFT
ncbi:hypothetical protein PPERSA_04849 [Pseudocohnilembus persalinus]|uniref:Transmembrane protein n=1 Tax=Pseudocohnilembus persalinus TaxID=266149 RepID=A0A0V0QIT2_PSEPJ|nr:hypothetical protein PPERSA_04849 [Pseudocohnilembus persalinus]|eukprot:KRX02227.1 hypothetical protein PPERSA_04849 [Pseudocohnilembus persalinus]